jgi:hypothetical protein
VLTLAAAVPAALVAEDTSAAVATAAADIAKRLGDSFGDRKHPRSTVGKKIARATDN